MRPCDVERAAKLILADQFGFGDTGQGKSAPKGLGNQIVVETPDLLEVLELDFFDVDELEENEGNENEIGDCFQRRKDARNTVLKRARQNQQNLILMSLENVFQCKAEAERTRALGNLREEAVEFECETHDHVLAEEETKSASEDGF